jgi:hypothetical protein
LRVLDSRLPLGKHFKSRFPAANVSRINEVVTTNTYFSDTPALEDGIMVHGETKMVQPFCGCSSLLTAVYPMRHESNVAGTLEDFIRHYGAPNALFSDNAKSQIGRAVLGADVSGQRVRQRTKNLDKSIVSPLVHMQR